MVIDKKILDELTRQAKVNPRLRQAMDLRNSPEDGSQRMLNVEKDRWHSLECLETGSILYESKDGPYHPLEEDEVMNVEKKVPKANAAVNS